MTRFYDAHCHMMNLSHPNLSAMLGRAFKDLSFWDKLKIGFGAFLYAIPGVGGRILAKVSRNAMNLLAIMETELGDCLLQMEEDLRKNLGWETGPVLWDGVGGRQGYDKIVLTPLIMDFGLKNYQNPKTIYRVRWKPIASQVMDIGLGIKYYYNHRQNHPFPGPNPNTPLFEIYPFMGINTRNYQMGSGADGAAGLRRLLVKNFAGFKRDTAAGRRTKLAAYPWQSFSSDIDKMRPYGFIGIKVYPPLGFDPWPAAPGQGNEMKKVHLLYRFCSKRNIPITAHCSEGGFLVDKKYKELANPAKWDQVLTAYPNLRLNLAHFGAENEQWRNAIAGLILNPRYKNVYTDISYRGVDDGYYAEFRRFLDSYSRPDQERLMSRIIFGSDFMVNLMEIESYGRYMNYFAVTDCFTVREKRMFCSENPERFLFI